MIIQQTTTYGGTDPWAPAAGVVFDVQSGVVVILDPRDGIVHIQSMPDADALVIPDDQYWQVSGNVLILNVGCAVQLGTNAVIEVTV
jgi:hypothetical protein